MNSVRNEILNILEFYRYNRHLLPADVDMKFLRRSLRRNDLDDEGYLFYLNTYFMEDFEELLCNRLERDDELRAYRELFSFMDLHINYTMNQAELRKAMDLIGLWGRSLRMGNGEIPWWENERMHYNVIRKMGEIKNGK